MFWLKVTFISVLFCFVSSDLITKDFETTPFVSAESNIVSFDVIDDYTMDIHYKTSNEDFKCFVDWSPSTFETVAEKTFSNKIIGSFVTKDKVHLLHRGPSEDIYYSLFFISAEGDLEEISREQENESHKELEDLIFSPVEEKYVGLSDDSIAIFKTDNQGKFQQEKKLTFSLNDEDIEGKIYDAAYLDGLLYLAKGELGVQVVNMKNDKIKKFSISPSDLELKEGYTVTQVEVAWGQILFAYCTNIEDGFILVLDFSDLGEIKILNRYSLEVKNVIEIYTTDNQIGVVGNDENKYYFTLFYIPQDKHNTLKVIRHWEIPFKVTHVRRNEGTILIEGDDHFYVLKNHCPVEVRKAELVLDAIEKNPQESLVPVFQGNKQYLISLAENKIALLEVPKRQLSYSCGVFKRGYQGIVLVSLYVYRKTCPEVPAGDKDSICLYRYNYSLNFTGEEYFNYESNSLIPHELTTPQQNDEEIFNYYKSPHSQPDHPKNPNIPMNPDIPKEPNQPQKPETPKQPNQPQKPDTPKPNPNTPSEPHGHDIPTKEHKTFYVQYKNYILGLFGLSLFVLILCFMKCLWSCINPGEDEFKHEELKEIENDESGVGGDIEYGEEQKDEEENDETYEEI